MTSTSSAGSVYFDHEGSPCVTPKITRQPHARCRGRWRGEIQLAEYGKNGRKLIRKASGSTKTEVSDKLQVIREEIAAGGGKPGYALYTVRQACEDWLAEDPPGKTAKTILTNREALEHLLVVIGPIRIRELTASDVSKALRAMAERQSTAYVAKAHSALNRAIRHAAGKDRVARNVVSFTKPPVGQVRHKNRSMTLAQLLAVLAACVDDQRLYTYIAVCATTAIRTEEARELTWDRVHLDKAPPFVEVWRSVRAGGDVKTEKSRRTLALAAVGCAALTRLQPENASGYVFATRSGKPLDAANIRRDLRAACKGAGIGTDWTPRELRHTGISLMSLAGLQNEEIARIAGHATTRTLETVYRDELRPVITTGADALDVLLGDVAAGQVVQDGLTPDEHDAA